MRVPVYEKQTSRVVPTVSTPQELRPPSAAFGAEMADAATRLGETGLTIANALMKRAAERKKELMEKELIEQDTSFRKDLQNVLYNDQVDDKGKPVGFLNRKLDQAQNVTPEFDNTYYTIRKHYLNNVAAPEQKEALARRLDQTYLSSRDTIIRHERQQVDESIQNSFKSNLDIQVNDAAQLQDGPSVIRAIEQAIVTQNSLSKISGFDEKTAEAERVKITGKVAKSAFASAMAENNLIKAQSIYNAIKGKVPAEIEQKMKEEVESGIPYNIAITDAFLDPITTRKKIEENAYNIKDPVKRKAAYDFTNTLAEKMIADGQETRHNKLLDNLATEKLTLRDIENEMQIPEEAGGLKKKILVNYQRAIQNGIQRDLNRMLTEKDSDKDPTKRAKEVKEYLKLIDAFVSEDTDKWHAREKLAEAYADGIINSQETRFLNALQKNLKHIEFNRYSGPINSAIKGFKSWMGKNNASDEEITFRIKQLLGTLQDPQANPQEAVKAIMNDHLRSKIPEIDTISPKGQLMMDAYGNKAIVYPDGTIEPVVTYKEKTKTEGQK
ncbi:MAG: hypothetical protein C4540_04565 [Candidatus Omnitrophota bacterium]|jgi:hypothetical protein|nr:MAG: hypothetical protein C4540_04565 [Candidatus Omnitrophota bacterium]